MDRSRVIEYVCVIDKSVVPGDYRYSHIWIIRDATLIGLFNESGRVSDLSRDEPLFARSVFGVV